MSSPPAAPGVSKRRLLEIYFNIIEWGPGIHGADEASHYYFGREVLWPTPTGTIRSAEPVEALMPFLR